MHMANLLQVSDSKIPSQSDAWFVKVAEDIVYVSSDSGDSNVCNCLVFSHTLILKNDSECNYISSDSD